MGKEATRYARIIQSKRKLTAIPCRSDRSAIAPLPNRCAAIQLAAQCPSFAKECCSAPCSASQALSRRYG
jgi:hypothetical protein